MKKIIASIAAFSMCALILTACGEKTTGDADAGLTESITAEQTNATVAEPANDDASAENDSSDDAAEDKASEETEADSSDKSDAGSSDAAASYATLEEFIKADGIFDVDGDLVDGKDTYTYSFFKSLEGGNGFYIDMKALDESMSIVMAMSLETKQIAIDIEGAVDGTDITNMSLILTDGKMYMLEPSSKTGFYMDLSEEQLAEMFDEYDPEEILSEVNIDPNAELEGLMSYKVDIGGTVYTFEFADDSGMLYDPSGKICTVVSGKPGTEVPAVLINEFSTNVPGNAFDIPSDYELADMGEMAALFAQ